MNEQDKKPVFEAEIPDELPMEKELRRVEEAERVAEQPSVTPQLVPAAPSKSE